LQIIHKNQIYIKKVMAKIGSFTFAIALGRVLAAKVNVPNVG
jgi:hypothetical protein